MRSFSLPRPARRPIFVLSAALLALMLLVALVGPFLCSRSPYEIDPAGRLAGPSLAHPLGTDYAGRDLLTRLIYGARASVGASLLSTLLGCLIGVGLGLLAGYFGGLMDAAISRVIEMLMALPGIFLAILTVALIGPGTGSTVAAVSVMVVPAFARMTRAAALKLREADFVKACALMGASHRRILLRHILPGCLPQVLVIFTLSLGTAAVTTASLSFVGLGVSPPHPEWGAMMSAAKQVMRDHPLSLLAPGGALTLFVMSASLVGDGLQELLNPLGGGGPS